MTRHFGALFRAPETPAVTAAETGLRGMRRAVAVLCCLLAAESAVALVRVLPFLQTRGGDFANLHRGAAAMLAGASAFSRPELDYPPLVPVLLAPLALLPLAEAREVWLGLSLLALLVAAWATWRLAGGDIGACWALGAVLVLEGSVLPNLALGQTNPLLLMLFALALLFHGSHPRRAAAMVGLAAAWKVWPGILLLSWLPGSLRPSDSALSRGAKTGDAGRRPRPPGLAVADAARIWGSGLGVWALGVALPWALLAIATAPPHLPLARGYWLGTPALLNFSAPAAVLRATYDWRSGSPPPADWEAGVSASWVLARDRQLVSAGVSLLVLAAGLAALGWRLSRLRSRRSRTAAGGEPTLGRDIACALVALAIVAAPISWYHYQLLQLPAFVLALGGALRTRRWGVAVALAAVVLTLTRHEWVVGLVQLFAPDSPTALYWTGILLPLVGAAWFGSRVLAIGASGASPVSRGWRAPRAPAARR